MNPILVLDAGNSRLKWGLAGAQGWLALGQTSHQDIETLALTSWKFIEKPERIIGVNVASTARRQAIEAQAAPWHLPVEWLTPQRQAAGVHNHYADPTRLGADRWAALVAVRRRQLQHAVGGNQPAPCLVVSFGTAVTIDALTANGHFLGGLILPGVGLMRSSLAASTAALTLDLPAGQYADFPTTTADALHTGAIAAVCGAIAEMRRRLIGHASSADAPGMPIPCFIAGGDANHVAAHLTEPLAIVDNLVLEGVLILAAPEQH